MPEVWERQEGETAKAHDAFCAYRDMGVQRSTRKVAEVVGKDDSLIFDWSSKHNWVGRVAQYDAYLDDIRRAEHEEEIRKMHETHAAQARALQGTAVTDLHKVREMQAKSGEEEIVLAPELILRYLETGSKLERTARGEPDVMAAFRVHDGDAMTAAIATDEGVREAAHDLVRAAAEAREAASITE